MKNIILIISILSLTACTTLKEKQDLIVNDKIGNIYIKPLNFMEKCEALNKLKDGTQQDIIDLTIDTIKKYKECSNKHQELKYWIERNIK